MPNDEPTVPDDVREIVATIMGDFEQSNDRRGFVAGDASYTFDLDNRLVPEPAVLLFLLKEVLGLANLGRFEKTAWEAVFLFHGHRGSIADRKLGVQLYLDRTAFGSRSEAAVAAAAIRKTLRRALKVLWDRYLSQYASERLRTGNITILNQAFRLRELFDYFRTGAELSYAGDGRLPRETVGGGSRIFARETEGFFNSVAMVTGYFSWFEHVLVLALAFQADATEPVDTFLRMTWGAKFRRTFDVGSDRLSLRVYEGLREVADTFRNPYAHGATDPRRGSVAFHVRGAGAVSMGMRRDDLSPSLWLLPFDERGFKRSIEAFAAADALLRDHERTRLAMRWIEAGMEVAYDSQSRLEYERASSSDSAFQAYLENRAHLWEQAVNMDW